MLFGICSPDCSISFADNATRIAIAIVQVVLAPFFFLGLSVLYFEQRARAAVSSAPRTRLGGEMPKYLMLSTLSDQGLQTLRANPDRLREVNKDVEELGAKVIHQWFVLGPYDFVNIVEAEKLRSSPRSRSRSGRAGASRRSRTRCSRSTTSSSSSAARPPGVRVDEPTRLPDWVTTEVASWPQDAWGAHQTRLLLRDGRVIEPVAVLPSGDVVGWGQAGEEDFVAEDIVAIERIDE